MARSTKGARHITVGGVAYRWRATGNDEFISLTVWPGASEGPSIVATVGYHETWVPRPMGSRAPAGDQLVITNRLVRRIIQFAVNEHGHDAARRGRQLDLRCVDGQIDLSDAVRARRKMTSA